MFFHGAHEVVYDEVELANRTLELTGGRFHDASGAPNLFRTMQHYVITHLTSPYLR